MFRTFDKLVLLLAVSIIFGEYLADAECPADRKKPWSYDRNLQNGPKHWGKTYPLCDGKTQSPIDIQSKNTVKGPGSVMQQIGYDEPITKFQMENNGHTVMITPKDDVTRAVLIKRKTYTLVQFHYHWGSKQGMGSEHHIHGKAGDMELHLVHKASDGNIAVLGVLIKVKGGGHDAHGAIVRNLKKVKYSGDQTEVNGNDKKNQIKLSLFLPTKKSYYTYNGSLTTPPCSPEVTWIVYGANTHIDGAHLNSFRHLISTTKENEGKNGKCHLVNNFRAIQKINGRKIYHY